MTAACSFRSRGLAVATALAVGIACGGPSSDVSNAEHSPPATTSAPEASPAGPVPTPATDNAGPPAPMVAAGDGTSFVLTSAGEVYAWGDQTNGRLGTGVVRNASTTTPSRVGVTGVQAIAIGDAHGLALRGDGVVFAWGANDAGQLGNGETGTRTGTPIRVEGLGRVVAIAAGRQFSMALDTTGGVYTWGDNVAAQLGLGDGDTRTSPTRVAGLEGIRTIGAGGQHAFAVDADGTVFAWGNNQDGQLGLGIDDANVLTPRRVTGLPATPRVRAIDGGRFHTVVLLDDGTVRTFGASNVGQAGSDSGADREATYRAPISPAGVSGATGIAAGDEHTLVVTREHVALAFGHAGDGRLGDGRDGRSQSSSLPSPAHVADVVAVAAGSRHSLVLTTDGTVGCFGSSFLGQCGTQGFSEVPTPIAVQGVRARP